MTTALEINCETGEVTERELTADELAQRDLIPNSHGDGNEMIDKIFQLRRLGKNYEKELDEYLYFKTGRAI
jgi:hypothetical protein